MKVTPGGSKQEEESAGTGWVVCETHVRRARACNGYDVVLCCCCAAAVSILSYPVYIVDASAL
jgi:hypothetical protein